MSENLTPHPQPNGRCFCGCKREVGYGRFFAQGHDKMAEAAYMAVHHSGSVARLLVDTGFGPDAEESIRDAALDRGGWDRCPHCGYVGAPASIRKHIGKDHEKKEI